MYIKNQFGIFREADMASIPVGSDVMEAREYEAWRAAGNEPKEQSQTRSFEEQAKALEAALDRELDRVARAKGYRDIVSACSYTGGSPEHRFTLESKAFSLWRQNVWDTAYGVLAEVKAGHRDMPTEEEAIALMPPLVLPS